MVAIMEPTTIQKVVQIAGTLTDEAIRNGSIKKNPEKRGIEENLARIGMEGMITREIEMEMLLLQPQILLGERTRVGNPSVPPVTFTVHLRHPVALVSTIPLQWQSVHKRDRKRRKRKQYHLKSTKSRGTETRIYCSEIDFPEVFPDDLSGLPHIQEIEFWIEFVPGAIPVAKSPYRLAPSEMGELSGQLKQL
ncbi:hypothetical protein Tco_0005522 [Tanacetum coccineum]